MVLIGEDSAFEVSHTPRVLGDTLNQQQDKNPAKHFYTDCQQGEG
jgi:hypothetical protein